jgi:cytochrome P450
VNIFATRDEKFHSLRRRQLSHAFSQSSILRMEEYIDGCLSQLVDALDRYAHSGEVVDLKSWIRLYIFDVLGELAFSQSFDALKLGNERILPPVSHHVRLGTVLGQIPEYTTQLLKTLAYVPLPWVQRLFNSRAKMAQVLFHIQFDSLM